MKKVMVLLSFFVILSGFTNEKVDKTINEVKEFMGGDISFEEESYTLIYADTEGKAYYHNEDKEVRIFLDPVTEIVDHIRFYYSDKDTVLDIANHFNVELSQDEDLMLLLSSSDPCHGEYLNVFDGVLLNIKSYELILPTEKEEYLIVIDFNQPKFEFFYRQRYTDKLRMGCEI